MKKGYKECPFCANEIKEKAIKCQYCGEFLNKGKKENNNEKKEKTKECPFCLNEIDIDEKKCPFCEESVINTISVKRRIKKSVKEDDIDESDVTMKISKEKKVDNRSQSNRLSRSKFFMYTVLSNGCCIGLTVLLAEKIGDSAMIFRVINFIIHIFLIVKRLHDCGKSGWRALLFIFLGPFACILYFIKGDEGVDNKYGPAS